MKETLLNGLLVVAVLSCSFSFVMMFISLSHQMGINPILGLLFNN